MKKINLTLIITLSIIATTIMINLFLIKEVKRAIDTFIYIIFLFLPFLLNRFKKTELNSQQEFAYLIFITLSNFLGRGLNFYIKIKYYDMLIHFIYGILSIQFAIYILTKLKLYNKKRYITMTIMFVIIALGISSFWEIVEFFGDVIFNTNFQSRETGIIDTMQDLVLALFGVLISSSVYISKHHQ